MELVGGEAQFMRGERVKGWREGERECEVLLTIKKGEFTCREGACESEMGGEVRRGGEEGGWERWGGEGVCVRETNRQGEKWRRAATICFCYMYLFHGQEQRPVVYVTDICCTHTERPTAKGWQQQRHT